MSVPSLVKPEEALGRGVFSSKEARRAERQAKVRFNVFLEKEGVQDISVDRLDHASGEEAVLLGERAAQKRNRTFYGWGVVDAAGAASKGRQVRATPKRENPYHADIILPDITAVDREEQKAHAQQLADLSCWRSRHEPVQP